MAHKAQLSAAAALRPAPLVGILQGGEGADPP